MPTFRKKIGSTKGPQKQAQDVIDFDKLKPESFEKDLAKFNKLPISSNIRYKGKVYTIGQLKSLQKKKASSSKKNNIKGKNDAKKMQKAVENRFNKEQKAILSKKVASAKSLVSLARTNRDACLARMDVRVSREAVTAAVETINHPHIDGLSVSTVITRDPVVIIGRNFGDIKGEVIMTHNGNRIGSVGIRETSWSDTMIEIEAPRELGQVEDLECELYLITKEFSHDAPSNKVPLVLQPKLVIRTLAHRGGYREDHWKMSEHFDFVSDRSCNIDERSTRFLGIPISHITHINKCTGLLELEPGWYGNCVGSFKCFEGFTLQNTWVVEEIKVMPTMYEDFVQLGSYQKGSPSMEVEVNYDHRDMGLNRKIYLFVYIKGPVGVDAKISKN
jgi:hypothetical protein